jgi:hypothetical protein
MSGNLIELFDSQAEWQSGTLENLDATTQPGRIIPTGDYTKAYDSQVEWNQGSMSSVQSAAGGTIALTPVPQNWKAATVTASSYVGEGTSTGNAPDKAFDGDTDTYWLATSSSNEWLKFDYGGTKRTVTKLRIYINSTDDLQVKNFQLQGSDDGSQWTILATGRTTLGANGWQEWDVPSPRQHRYYRLMCLDNHAPASPMIAVREMEFILQAQYPGSGTWLSPWLAHGISSPRSGLVSLRAETPSGTGVIPHVRYSPNGGSTYTQWYDLDDRRMTDLQGTHVQLRLTLTTDDTKQTPVVDRALLLVGKLHRWTSPVIDLAGVDADAILMLATSQTELDVVREVREPFNLNFTRASTAYNPETGEQVGVNQPRYVEGPFDGSQAVLVEEGTTNIWAYSDPTIAQMPAKGNVTDAGGVGDRFSNGVYFGDNSVVRYAYRQDALSPGTLYTLSCYVLMDDGEAPVATATTSSGDFSIIIEGSLVTNPAIVDSGGGLYRVSGSFTTRNPLVSQNCGIVKYTGQSARGFKVSGFQIEAKGYATTLVHTNGTAATRSPEIATIPTAEVLNFSEGTMELRFRPTVAFINGFDGYNRIIGHSTAMNTNELEIFKSGSGSSRLHFAISNSAAQWAGDSYIAVQSTTSLVADTWYHIAAAWSVSEGRFSLYINGQKEGEAVLTADKIPSVIGTLAIGYHPNGTRWANGPIADLRISSKARSDEEILQAYQSNEPLPVDEWTTYKMVGGLWESVGVAFPCSGRQTLQARLTLTKTDSVAQSLDSVALWESVLMWMYDRPDLRVSPPQVTHVTAYVENSEPVVEYTTSIAVEESKKVHIRVPVPEGSSLAYCQQVAEKILALKSEERLSIACKIPLLTRMRFGESVAVVMPYAGYTRENPYFGVIQKMTHYPLASPPYTEIQIGEYLPEDIEVLLRLYSSQKGGM